MPRVTPMIFDFNLLTIFSANFRVNLNLTKTTNSNKHYFNGRRKAKRRFRIRFGKYKGFYLRDQV